MSITVELNGFCGPFQYLNGKKTIQVNRLDLVRGILTVGKANLRSVLTGGMLRIMEMVGLSMQAFAYTTVNASGLNISSLYRDLDRSEKGAASYRFGMGIAKLVGEAEIGVPWLIHVDPLILSGAIFLATGSRERGDLVGQDAKGNWHVIEAKARSNRPPLVLYSVAKKQASRIVSINNTSPKTHCASVADLSSSPISVYFADPERESGEYETTQIEVDDLDFFREYYYLTRQFINENYPFERTTLSTSRGGMDFVVVNLLPPPYRFDFGCRAEIYSLIRDLKSDSIRSFARLAEELVNNLPRAPQASIGLDGHVVIGTDISQV